MNARQVEVHRHYKALHPEALVLYRIPGRYVVLGDDVGRAEKSFPDISVLEPGVGVMPGCLSVLSVFGNGGSEVCVIRFRNADGVLDLPDIGCVKEEMEMDYCFLDLT